MQTEQAILIYIKLSDDGLGSPHDSEFIFSLEDQIKEVIIKDKHYEYDGHEFGGGYCILFMYALNADDLYRKIRPTLKSTAFPGKSYLVRRYGPPGSEQDVIELTATPKLAA